MKLLSRIALLYAKFAPRGYWKVMEFAAHRDSDLHDVPIPLAGIPGVSIRADFRETVYLPMFRNGCIPHQKGLDHFLRKVILDGEVVLDVGANVGYTAILMSTIVGVSGQVHAFEPGKRIFSQLKRNTSNLNNVRAWNIAIGDYSGTIDFFESNASDLSSVIKIAGAKKVLSEVKTIDDFMIDNPEIDRGRLVLIKIDVEGFEANVLRGASSVLKSSTPPIIVFESLDADKLKQNLNALPEQLLQESVVLRIGESGTSTDLSDDRLSCDFAIIPKLLVHRINASPNQ